MPQMQAHCSAAIYIKEQNKVITVFSTGPTCFKCNLTKKHLTKRGAPFEEVRVDQDEDEAELLRELGFQSAPVVHAGATVFEGYRPDMLDALAQTVIAGPELNVEDR